MGRDDVDEHPVQSGLCFFLGESIQRGKTPFILIFLGFPGTMTPVIVTYDGGTVLVSKDIGYGNSTDVNNDCNLCRLLRCVSDMVM